MYSHCLFCNGSLGANRIVEAFPVGRRLAFDSAKGRLWVVCKGCQRWNLTPIEERWEAVEQCEQFYRESPQRAATDHIGIAKHREGLELVRIGTPRRPEFAAWRYGAVLGRRAQRIRAVTYAVAIIGLARLLPVPAPISAALAGTQLIDVGWRYWRRRFSPIGRVDVEPGGQHLLRARDLRSMRLLPVDGSVAAIHVTHRLGTSVLEGAAAERVLNRALAAVNAEGAGKQSVLHGVERIDSAGGPEGFLRDRVTKYSDRAGGRKREYGTTLVDPSTLVAWDPVDLIAAEMALHEETERVAMEGELRHLEAAWRDAEEIAAISDNLLLQPTLLDRLRRLRSD